MAALATTLAVLSLATALKDIVEVAQQIRDAFEQVPENYRKAREMSEDILQFAQDINILYEEGKDVFEREQSFKKSLEGLLHEMNSVKDQCAKLVPPLSEKKRDRFKIALYAFWNRYKVMSLISELKNRMDRRYNHFLVVSTIGIKADVGRITQYVQSSSTSGIVSSIADTRLVFMQPDSFSIPHMRGTIPEHDLRSQYITVQLGSCRQLLETFMSKCFQTPSMSFAVDSKMTWQLHIRPFSQVEYYDQAVQEIIIVQRMLCNAKPANVVNIIDRAKEVASALYKCEMLHEAAAVMEWVTQTWRQMTSTFPSNRAKYYLMRCLRQNAEFLGHIGKFDKACDCIDEGKRIANKLILKKGESPWLLKIMADLLSTHSLLLLRTTGRFGYYRIVADRAAWCAEESVVKTCSSLLAGKLIVPLTYSSLTDITTAISVQVNSGKKHDLSDRLCSLLVSLKFLDRYLRGDLDHQTQTMEIARLLLRFYPDSKEILEIAADVMFDLSSNIFRLSDHDSLKYAKQSVDIYRRLFEVCKSSRYILPFSEALVTYGKLLSSLNMHREHEDVLQEVTSLAEAASSKYFVTGLPSKIEGDYYLHIAEMYDSQGRWQDAIDAAKNAAAQYTGLQLIDKDWDPFNHLKLLEILCRLYYNSGQYQCALWEGRKAFTIAANSIDRYPRTNGYACCLNKLSSILDVLKNLSQGPIPGTVVKTSPSFKQFIILFKSELANPMVFQVYAHTLTPLWSEYNQLDRQRQLKHAIDLVDKLILPNVLNLKIQLMEPYIVILLRLCRFQEALRHSRDLATATGYVGLDLFWSQIYSFLPCEAIDVAREYYGIQYQQFVGGYPCPTLAIALFDAGKVEEGLSCVLADINKDKGNSFKRCCLWLASQLHFAMKNYSEAGRIVNEIPGNFISFNSDDTFDSIMGCLTELGFILFAGLMFCCSGDHEKGREALSRFACYIKDEISLSGPDVIPIMRLGLSAEQKRGKWRLICDAAKAFPLQCDHMELVLNGSWAEIAAPHL